MRQRNLILIGVEILVMAGIVFAFVSPLFSPSETEDETSSRIRAIALKINTKSFIHS
ncbi:hypothetical protein [Hydrococcus rivularis]|uniref:hypothetical protein n=1 Tax=Hydrococcus rivularis TaxID=1616834 RepID=UPI001587FB9C|nr:hypothetical protein [Hydrococcus rivularis]